MLNTKRCVIIRFWKEETGSFLGIRFYSDRTSIEVFKDGKSEYLGSPIGNIFPANYQEISPARASPTHILYFSNNFDAMMTTLRTIRSDMSLTQKSFYDQIIKILKAGDIKLEAASSSQRTLLQSALSLHVAKERVQYQETVAFESEYVFGARKFLLANVNKPSPGSTVPSAIPGAGTNSGPSTDPANSVPSGGSTSSAEDPIDYQNLYETLQNEHTDLQTRYQALLDAQGDSEQLKTVIQQLYDELQAKLKQITQLQAKITTLETQNADLTEENKKITSAYKDVNAGLTLLVSQYKEELNILKQKADSLSGGSPQARGGFFARMRASKTGSDKEKDLESGLSATGSPTV